LLDYHNPLPINHPARIRGETVRDIIMDNKYGHISLMKIVQKYKQKHPDEHGFSKKAINKFINNDLGMIYRKTNIKDIAYYANYNQIAKCMFFKKVIEALKDNHTLVFYDECLFQLANSNFKSWKGKNNEKIYKGIQNRHKLC
jgi:hypothetical protein